MGILRKFRFKALKERLTGFTSTARYGIKIPYNKSSENQEKNAKIKELCP